MSATLAEGVAVSSREARARTNGGEVHERWEGDGPVVVGINHKATVELKEWPTLEICVAELKAERTKSPSASHWFMAGIG